MRIFTARAPCEANNEDEDEDDDDEEEVDEDKDGDQSQEGCFEVQRGPADYVEGNKISWGFWNSFLETYMMFACMTYTNFVIFAVVTFTCLIVMIFSWCFGQGQEIEWEETTMNKTLHSTQ